MQVNKRKGDSRFIQNPCEWEYLESIFSTGVGQGQTLKCMKMKIFSSMKAE